MYTSISRQKYTRKFKQDAIQLAKNIGVPKAASKLKLNYHTLYNWHKITNYVPQNSVTDSTVLPGFGNKIETKVEEKVEDNSHEIVLYLRKVADLLEKRAV